MQFNIASIARPSYSSVLCRGDKLFSSDWIRHSHRSMFIHHCRHNKQRPHDFFSKNKEKKIIMVHSDVPKDTYCSPNLTVWMRFVVTVDVATAPYWGCCCFITTPPVCTTVTAGCATG